MTATLNRTYGNRADSLLTSEEECLRKTHVSHEIASVSIACDDSTVSKEVTCPYCGFKWDFWVDRKCPKCGKDHPTV
jgi:DNA-directed RNA polymerase subunit RPC12/RpoP